MAEAEGSCITTIRLALAEESDTEKLDFVEQILGNCDAVQQMVLAEILKQNRETEYLRHHGLDGSTDRSTFKSKIPIVSYEDMQPYIQRIADGGDYSILSGRPISEFLTSSGTSGGERKLMPTLNEDLDRRHFVHTIQIPIIKQFVSGLDQGKALCFFYVKSESKTPSGLIARPALTSYYKSSQFRSKFQNHSSQYTSPIAAILCNDSHQSMYIQLLCGLYQRLHVVCVGAVFASGFIRTLHFFQTHWPDLARDISAGTLSPSITDPSLHAAVADVLRPDPELSLFLSEECSKPNWAGIITRIWPNTKYLKVVITGSMAQYIPTLEFYSGGLPMVSQIYASSESYFGINIKPLCPPSEITYVMLPHLAYFEFAPIEGGDGGDEKLVDLAAVELGKEYELVITTYAGLYRYRVGDVLSVAGFYKSSPQFKFLRRKNVVLSIESDKTDEAELQRAVERASELLAAVGAGVAEYTSHACTETIPGHYVIYWELFWKQAVEEAVDGELLGKCCLEMEEELNSVYRQSRVADRSIGPLEIRVVQTGIFQELMDYAVSKGASITQYKVPRCVNQKPIIELLDLKVISAHFSPGLPQWNPNRFG